ncbi:hypothetical protein, partial [Tritonibacter sp. SIMBA_163]|uniref:hypothetical protein n=1 Tax=Tritonibacter sp. SIMBA_163 TaxID=3080868 RepID=UPI003980764B
MAIGYPLGSQAVASIHKVTVKGWTASRYERRARRGIIHAACRDRPGESCLMGGPDDRQLGSSTSIATKLSVR